MDLGWKAKEHSYAQKR